MTLLLTTGWLLAGFQAITPLWQAVNCRLPAEPFAATEPASGSGKAALPQYGKDGAQPTHDREGQPAPAAQPTPAAQRELSAADWASIRAAYEAGKHAFYPTEGGFQARTPGQAWMSRFDTHGFTITPDQGTWSWGLQLESYGWGERQRKLGVHAEPLRLSHNGARLERHWDGHLTEWFVNDLRGLEHGFTLLERPASAIAAPGSLRLELSILGGLEAAISADATCVAFQDAADSTVLNYSGLLAFDATGQRLPAAWELQAGNRLVLQVEEQGAKYPLTIDPIAQQAYLKASNTATNDNFGTSVALSGNTLVVGADGEDSAATGINGNQADNSASGSGAAYVFVRSGSTWAQQAYLKASNTGSGDRFGLEVALSGDTLLVSAIAEASAATGINGNQLDNSSPLSGAAYVFVRNGSTWSQQAYLKASNTGAGDQFGFAVAISGDSLVVGSWFEDSAATGVNGNQADESASTSGAAYVFVRSGATWTQQAYLKASNTGTQDSFGEAVGISGETVVVGAQLEDSAATGPNGNQADNSASDSGAAYVFVRSGTAWTQQAYLKASNTQSNDWFGGSVALSGDTLVLGAQQEDSSAPGVNGNQADNSMPSAGAAYVFMRSGASWSQQAYLKASNPDSQDGFGRKVAISGDTLVVGANLEDSAATGINGNQADNSATGAGAAYAFLRTGATWSQLAYLKASNAETVDGLGRSVAISGDTVAAGAPLEDSAATGVNGNQADNSAGFSGATYTFDLDLNPGTVSYGSGTPGCAGAQLLEVNHAPMIGSPGFAFTCSNAPPSSAGFGVLATAPDLAGSDPLALGVLLHVDLLFSTALISLPFSSDALGNGFAPAPIPNKAALVGKTLYAQVLWAWSACSLPPFNLSTSNGLALTFLVP
jgi:FG-GAP repeat